MCSLPTRNKKILVRKIRNHKKRCFPGKGGGVRLAAEIGVPPQTVSDWLNGRRTPTFRQIYLLTKTFNVSPIELCGIREKDRPTRNAADSALLRSLLEVLEYAIKHSDAGAETMESVNAIAVKEMEEMNVESRGNLS